MAAGRRSGRRRRRPIDPWRVFAHLLSGIFMTVGVFLILLAFSEIIIYVIDSSMYGNDSYLDWWSTPLLMVIVSLPFFLGYLIINLNRFSFFNRLKEKVRMPGPREDSAARSIDNIELD